ncbi:hypothetical protein DRO58_09530 [Candidatus Bathyarchaeota archaeon]|nr:MAG: hypothetical protein DRO58_09530 [Candidatus Bathyarchaeota archaeon]
MIAHNPFVREDVRPAEGLVALNLTKDEEVGLILWGKVHAWNLPDTGEVTWDVSEPGFGLLTVDTSRTVAAVGFIAGRELDFGDVVIELNDTVLDGFAAVSLTVIDGENLSNCERMLLIAVG